MCPLSVLPGVHIKRVNFREKAFFRDKRNCLYKAGVLIKWVSAERGSTASFFIIFDQNLVEYMTSSLG